MERTRILTHAGKQVVLFDYTGLTDEAETIAVIERSIAFVARRRPDGTMLLVTDGSGSRYTRPVMEALKKLAAHNRPFVKASAAVSDSTLHRVVISTLAIFTGRRIQFCGSRQEALDWVVRQ